MEDCSFKDFKKIDSFESYSCGLLDAINISYSQHVPLILKPSDFILAISQGLSKHVLNNSEKLRKHFVNHSGKEKIEIRRDNFLLGKGFLNDWSSTFPEFAEKIKEKIISKDIC